MGTAAYIVFVTICLSIVVASALWSTRRDRRARIDKALYERALRKERARSDLY